jgi:hypothetical protein
MQEAHELKFTSRSFLSDRKVTASTATPFCFKSKVWQFRFSFAMLIGMTTSFHGPPARIHPFVITCKRCRQNIAAPVQSMPDSWIIHSCPLCGERRRYLPAEIFKGRLSADFVNWAWRTKHVL